MPSSRANHEPQVSDDDDNVDFQDASNINPQVQTMQVDNVEALIKRKNAYAKGRLTLTENLLNRMDRDSSTAAHGFRDTDAVLLDKHLQDAEKAIDAVNNVMESSSHLMTPEDIDKYFALLEAHSPRILDIRVRINKLKDTLESRSSSSAQSHANVRPAPIKKIDTTFRPDPLPEDASPAIFHQWRDQFNIFIARNNLDRAPFNEQRVLVTMCLSPEMDQTLRRASQPGDSTTMPQLIDKLESLIVGSTNLITRRYRYFNCLQKPTETIKQYIVRFRQLGDYASFEKFTYDDNMSCRLISGVHDDQLRKELLRLPKHDFESVYNYAIAWDCSNSGAMEMSQGKQSESNLGINKMSTYKANKKNTFHKNVRSSSSSSATHDNNPCQYCGATHEGRDECQARGHRCSYCRRMGHFSRVCRRRLANSKQSKKVRPKVRTVEEDIAEHEQEHQTEESDIEDDSHVNIVDGSIFKVLDPAHSRPTPKLFASFAYNNKCIAKTWCLPDTGATVSVMPLSLVKSWNMERYVNPKDATDLKSANGTEVLCSGTLELSVTVQGSSTSIMFYVCSNVSSILISWHALYTLGAIPQHFPDILPGRENKVYQLTDSLLLKDELIQSFPRVFQQNNILPCMNGEKMKIILKNSIDWPNVKQTFKPRPIPSPLRQAAKSELDIMLQRNIIKPVTCPTDFTSPLLVIPKKDNKVRLVVDYTQLNKYVRRPTHPFPSVEEVRTMIPTKARFFATLDAVQGYWQVPLCENSQLLTTFITPWGRYAYTRAPMGLSSSGDVFCQKGDEAFGHLGGVIKVVDDMLVYASSQSQLKERLTAVLNQAHVHGITLSPEKFNIGTSVTFMGLLISSKGISPDPRHVKAIADFPTPKNKTDLRSFLGLVNQFAAFSKSISTHSKAIRPLLSKDSDWRWDRDHDVAFTTIKHLLTTAPVLQYFDPKLPTKLITDASKLNGLGFALLQKHGNDWALVSCGSRYISSTESNYAVCELEALAIAWAIRKSRIYLMGLPHFDVMTDHRPLVTMFNSSRLTRNDNPRLVRIMQQIAMYNFTVNWVPGRLHHVPDALSRSPVGRPDSLVASTVLTIAEPPLVDPALKGIMAEAKLCPDYCDLKKAIVSYQSSDVKKLKSENQGHIKAFAAIWDSLAVDSSTGLVILNSTRIVVPKRCRGKLLELGHAAHQGISRTKARLQSLYFWHGMSNDITQIVQACRLCQTHRAALPTQPISTHPVPKAPFEAVSCDLFEYMGSQTLTLVDRYSAYPLVAHFNKSPSSGQLISTLSKFFSDFGIPRSIRHDGAKPLVSKEFSAFLASHNIEDQLSSAYNPRSNGHAEASVKAMKGLVKKCWQVRQLDQIKFNNAILEWRNTPKAPGNLSPAELLFGRRQRTLLPTISNRTLSHKSIKKAVQLNYNSLIDAYNAFNSRKSHLTPLKLGDRVIIRNTISNMWDKIGTVKAIRNGGLSYTVESNGKLYLRNRSLLKKTHIL